MILRIALAALAAVLGWTVLQLGSPPAGLAAEAVRLAPQTGAAHPVTAVLLGYRAYDTLLEVAVLLLAVLAVPARADKAFVPESDPVLRGLVNGVVPLMVMVAGYLLWAGTKQPGGAFQGGAVLAAAAVLLTLAGVARPLDPDRPAVRVALAAGLAAFLAAMASGRLPSLLLPLEVALTVSIATALWCLFAAGRR
jgi:multisubunit Na+/H+ antiporter MnhB subunit